jgi:transcription termination/antitermination protein NusG
MRAEEKQWYAIHTRSRHEKHVEQILRRMELETYLPLRKAWSSRLDRKQMIEVPAVPGYLFVRCLLTAERRAAIKRSLGVVHVVEQAGRPAVIPADQVESLRLVLASEMDAAEHPYLRVGQRVRVKRGPFEGACGYLTRVEADKPRLVVAVDWVNRAVSVEIDSRWVEPED